MFIKLNNIFSKNKHKVRKRQWGTEKDTIPLPILHTKPTISKITLNRIAIILTIVFWFSYISSIVIRQLIDGPQTYDFTIEALSYTIVVSFLTFSSLVYLITRQGALERFKKHTRVPRAMLDSFFFEHQPSITVLVPSYKEETSVIRKTLLSAALQEYPNLRVVLLLDDNPNPTQQVDVERLARARMIHNEINDFLIEPLIKSRLALAKFSQNDSNAISKEDILDLINVYRWAAGWLTQKAAEETIADHVDEFFVEQVFRKLAEDLSMIADALEMSLKDNAKISYERIHQLYMRLIWIFTAEVEVFERKKYHSFSHEVNKAMNLNSYIGVMGGTYIPSDTPEGVILKPVERQGQNTITFPNSDYLLTLDADSILLREYCLRLVYLLEEPANARIAVAQTPYSSFRGAYSRIERLAGATTDIQHILHQGMTHYDATFWVGANAIIRKAALDDIVETEWIDGKLIKRFIQDRTVIEDTESSIDLSLHGWKLHNYPERLSYSATPPDFGSLVVQRRRWANGGLIIFAKLWSVIRHRKNRNELISWMEILLRVNYLVSIAWATIGLIFLLAYPYDGRLLSPLILLAAMPYFLTMASDLRYNGYKATDIFSIYGFNLILLPVNLAGVLKSIEQGLTGSKISFARTPKVKNRTTSGLFYVVAPVLIVAFSIFTVIRNVELQNWGNAAFAGFNAIAATWAIIAYIGIGNLLADAWIGLTGWLYVEYKTKTPDRKNTLEPTLDWKHILYQGNNTGRFSSTRASSIKS